MIRKLESDDLPLLADIMASWLKNTQVVFPIDRDGTIDYLRSVLNDPTYAAFGLFTSSRGSGSHGGVDFIISGWILGQVTEYTFLCKKVVSEMAWYINPLFRGSGKELMDTLINWGKEQGAEYAISTILLSAGVDRGLAAETALKNMGFSEFEKSYFKKV